MSFSKIFVLVAVAVFSIIGILGVAKRNAAKKTQLVELAEDKKTLPRIEPLTMHDVIAKEIQSKEELISQKTVAAFVPIPTSDKHPIPKDIDRINRLFTVGKNKLPFVETISYTSRVSWLKGRPAWIADYASHFGTSRHFIARSLNGKADYFTQKVSVGDRFNVFSKEKDLRFHLVVDIARQKMWFYAYDATAGLRYLLKTYNIGLGKIEKNAESGCLTPLGKYSLSDKVAIYKPGIEGYYQDQKIEMVQVFGTRWLPFKDESDECAALIKGFGIHGAPWLPDSNSGQLVEYKESIGQYLSSGCIRLIQQDMEELFSIVITKPTVIEIVKDFSQAQLPGVEWEDPLLTTMPSIGS